MYIYSEAAHCVFTFHSEVLCSGSGFEHIVSIFTAIHCLYCLAVLLQPLYL